MRVIATLTVALALGSASARAQAPYLVKDINPGANNSLPFAIAGAGERAYFTAGDPVYDMWWTEGTAESTTKIGFGAYAPPWASIQGDVLFPGVFPVEELTRTDGTVAGTRRISEIQVFSGPLARQGDRILFAGTAPSSSLGRPAVTDGTAEGTFFVPPPLGDAPSPLDSFYASAAAFAGGFGFGLSGQQIAESGAWWTSGTPGGPTVRLVDPFRRCHSAVAAAGRLFIQCTTPSALAVSDGTYSGTSFLPGETASAPLVAAGNAVFYAVVDDLRRSDGTPAGTGPVLAPSPFTGIDLMTAKVSNGILYFAGTTAAAGRELWRTDGTAAGTFMLRDIAPGTASGIGTTTSRWMTAASGGVVFAAEAPGAGIELWKSDGTAAGTVPLPEINPGSSSAAPDWLTTVGTRVYLSAEDGVHGRELWAVDVAAGAVTVADTSVDEGSSGTSIAAFTVSLESAAAVPVVVSYQTVAGTATAGVDFVAQSGTVTFPPGELVRTIEVPVLGDVTDEPNESFSLVLAPVGGAVIARNTAGAVIVDDDGPRVTVGAASVVEGNAGSTNAVFDVRLDTQGGPTASRAVVRYVATAGTATAGSDFTAVQGAITFPPGTASGTTVTLAVPVLGDTLDEPNETFLLTLDGQGDAAAGPPVVGSILDDDGVDVGFPVELSHGTTLRGDLAPFGGPGLSRDYYVMQQQGEASYELVVDEASGDAAPLSVQRIGSDGSTVLQAAAPVGTGTALSLRWFNLGFETFSDQHIRVESGSCGTGCGTDDTYRLRFYETTLRSARVNNTNGQVTVLLLQNLTDDVVTGLSHTRTEDGGSGGGQPFSVPQRGLLLLDTSENLFVPGSLWVIHDAPYGGLAGKVVQLDPATGLAFETLLTSKPR